MKGLGPEGELMKNCKRSTVRSDADQAVAGSTPGGGKDEFVPVDGVPKTTSRTDVEWSFRLVGRRHY